MRFIFAGRKTDETAEVQAWLQRALANAKTAKVLVDQDDPNLLVEAVTQVQQACEKAIKAILLANGVPYGEVTDMGHNAIGAYVNLMARMLAGSDLAEDVSRVLLKEDATEAASTLAKLALSGPKNRRNRNKVVNALKQVLPPTSGSLGNRALEVQEWRRLTKAFPPEVVEIFIAFHERFSDAWCEYINAIPSAPVDPRPLLTKEVQMETWVFGPDYARLPRRFDNQGTDTATNPILANLAEQMLNDIVEGELGHIDRRQWPAEIDIRGALLRARNWLTSLVWLFLCAMITTPHAVSSRYPAEEGSANNEMGSQHYDRKLGVVVCIGPLANHTEAAVQNLITHFRQIEGGYDQMLR